MYLGGSGGHQAVVRETKASYVMVGYVPIRQITEFNYQDGRNVSWR